MSTKGIWTVTRGKDGNHYINCSALGRVFHPAQLCTVDGLGIWNYEDLKDLAVAILSFEEAAKAHNKITQDNNGE